MTERRPPLRSSTSGVTYQTLPQTITFGDLLCSVGERQRLKQVRFVGRRPEDVGGLMGGRTQLTRRWISEYELAATNDFNATLTRTRNQSTSADDSLVPSDTTWRRSPTRRFVRRASTAARELAHMPDPHASRFVQLYLQNGSRRARARCKWFGELTDEEITATALGAGGSDGAAEAGAAR